MKSQRCFQQKWLQLPVSGTYSVEYYSIPFQKMVSKQKCVYHTFQSLALLDFVNHMMNYVMNVLMNDHLGLCWSCQGMIVRRTVSTKFSPKETYKPTTPLDGLIRWRRFRSFTTVLTAATPPRGCTTTGTAIVGLKLSHIGILHPRRNEGLYQSTVIVGTFMFIVAPASATKVGIVRIHRGNGIVFVDW